MAYCPNCAAVFDPTQKFCARCGQATSAAPIPPAVPIPAAIPIMVDARPSAVTVASALLLISCLVSLTSLASILIMPSRIPGIFLARSIGLWILWVVLTILVWQRQSWARIAILLLLAWSLVNLMLTGLRFSAAIFALLVPLLIDALRIGAAILLFKQESNTWFKK
jgi:hypothetical protein